MVKYFLLRTALVRKNIIMWSISKWLLLKVISNIKFSSSIHCEDLVGLLEVKISKAWGPSMIGSPWSFTLSALSTLSLQQFVYYSSGFPTPTLVLLAVSTCESLLQKAMPPYIHPIFTYIVCPDLEAAVFLCPLFLQILELLIFQPAKSCAGY